MIVAGNQEISGNHRPIDAWALYNESLLTEVIARASYQKLKNDGSGLEWPLAYLVVPIALNPDAETLVLQNQRVSLVRWALRNRDFLSTLPERIVNTEAATQRALRFGLRIGRLQFDEGKLIPSGRIKHFTKKCPQELKIVARSAEVCGRWFAHYPVLAVFKYLELV